MAGKSILSPSIASRLVVIAFLAMAGLAGIGLAWSVLLDYARNPIDPRCGECSVTVEIAKGTNFGTALSLLREKGVIGNEFLFSVLARLRKAPQHIRAGEYEISLLNSPDDLLRKLVRGEIKGYRIPFPEGFTVRQVAERLSAWNLVDYKTFLARARDPGLLDSLKIKGDSVEGYLYPETYIFTRSMGEEEIIRFMVRQFRKRQRPDWEALAGRHGMTLDEIVILASIIEKEAALSEEKPIISAVFHNRLKKRMLLQSDPTVIYDIPEFDGNLKKSHLSKNMPHNTYVHKGLPPGPICNPGVDSIDAALRPAAVPYLFFVARNDGSHHFSTTLSHHREAVLKYQIRKEK